MSKRKAEDSPPDEPGAKRVRVLPPLSKGDRAVLAQRRCGPGKRGVYFIVDGDDKIRYLLKGPYSPTDAMYLRTSYGPAVFKRLEKMVFPLQASPEGTVPPVCTTVCDASSRLWVGFQNVGAPAVPPVEAAWTSTDGDHEVAERGSHLKRLTDRPFDAAHFFNEHPGTAERLVRHLVCASIAGVGDRNPSNLVCTSAGESWGLDLEECRARPNAPHTVKEAFFTKVAKATWAALKPYIPMVLGLIEPEVHIELERKDWLWDVCDTEMKQRLSHLLTLPLD